MPLLMLIPVAVLSAFVVALCISPLVEIAQKHKIVDNPNPRKLNTVPVPILGGVGVFLGMTVATAVFSPEDYDKQMLYLFAGMLFMLYIGVCDDIIDMRALRKLAYQMLAIGLMVIFGGIRLRSFQGLFGVEELPWKAGIPFTVFYCIGIVNAINLIDGVDGLASGYGMLAAMLLGICFKLLGDEVPAILCFATFGALFPFFLANVYGQRNKMYIGDAGSLVLGILFAVLATRFLNNPGAIALVSSPITFLIAVFTIPVFDTLRVMVGRMLKHQSPFAPDQTHLHHILLGFGFSHARVTAIELCLTAVSIAITLSIQSLPQEAQLTLVMLAGLVITLLPPAALGGYKKRHALQIEKRRQAAANRKKYGRFHRTLRRIADGRKHNSI